MDNMHSARAQLQTGHKKCVTFTIVKAKQTGGMEKISK